MLKYLYTLLSWIVLMNFGTAQNDWIFKNERNGVRVYYKKTSDVYDLKMTTSVKSTTDGLIKLLSEIDHFPNWIYSVRSSRLIKRISDTESIYYILLDFPWPLNDRDMIMHSKLEFDEHNQIIYSRSVAAPNLLPPVKDVIRITNANLEWKIFPPKNDFVYFEYTNHSDPAGKIPDWLVNLVLEKGPMESIKKMRTFLQRTEYMQAKLAFLRERTK